jgi:nucleotide-binding universal stress UspA family protein
VEKVAAQLEFKGFPTSAATLDADPRHAIVDAAREWHADLVVMGSHGRRGLDRLVLGSVAESVVRHSPCSVEIVRMPAAA